MLSLTFSLLFSFETEKVTVAPAGIVAPLEPATGSLSVAVNVSPTLFVFVHRSAPDVVRANAVPAAIAPMVGLAGAAGALVSAALVGVLDAVLLAAGGVVFGTSASCGLV